MSFTRFHDDPARIKKQLEEEKLKVKALLENYYYMIPLNDTPPKLKETHKLLNEYLKTKLP